MAADRATADELTPRRIDRTSEEAAHSLMAYAYSVWGEDFLARAWEEAVGPAAPVGDENRFGPFLIPWSLYLWEPGGPGSAASPATAAAESLDLPAAAGWARRSRCPRGRSPGAASGPGKTPREAARTTAGHREVMVLIRDFENMERHRPNPQHAYDFNRLRRELSLDPE